MCVCMRVGCVVPTSWMVRSTRRQPIFYCAPLPWEEVQCTPRRCSRRPCSLDPRRVSRSRHLAWCPSSCPGQRRRTRDHLPHHGPQRSTYNIDSKTQFKRNSCLRIDHFQWALLLVRGFRVVQSEVVVGSSGSAIVDPIKEGNLRSIAAHVFGLVLRRGLLLCGGSSFLSLLLLGAHWRRVENRSVYLKKMCSKLVQFIWMTSFIS